MINLAIVMSSYGVRVLLKLSRCVDEVVRGLTDTFARRYIPSFKVDSASKNLHYDAEVVWEVTDRGFDVAEVSLGVRDLFRVRSPPPMPYINESPYFFLLQVLSRQYLKKGYLMLTDSVSIYSKGRTYLLLGYPHTGKSTILAIALAKGYTPLTTENTIVTVGDDGVEIIGGTDVLVFDPRVREVYGIDVPAEQRTRHGYGVVDLSRRRSMEKARVSAIYLLYCSYSSVGVSMSRVVGRKAVKTLWHFATSVIRGGDYYEPYPLNLSDRDLDVRLKELVNQVAKRYRSSFFEIFGSHLEVFKEIIGGST